MTKALIFDLDGVIVFTDKFHYKAWKQLADKLHIPFDEQTNNRLRGVSRMESLDIVLEQAPHAYSADEKIAFATQKNDLYRSYLLEMTPGDVTQEVRETLTALRAQGYLLAIGSSSKNTPLILDKTDTAHYFDAVSDGNNITKSKPDPEVFLKAAAFLGVAPAACTVVEDAVSGVQAAHAADMKAIAIGDAAANECGDWNIQSFAEIPDCIH